MRARERERASTFASYVFLFGVFFFVLARNRLFYGSFSLVFTIWQEFAHDSPMFTENFYSKDFSFFLLFFAFGFRHFRCGCAVDVAVAVVFILFMLNA